MIKASSPGSGEASREPREALMITPFLMLVLACYGVFMLVLGSYSLRSLLD